MTGRVGLSILDAINIKNVVIILSGSNEHVTSAMDETDCDIPIIGDDHLIVVDGSVAESVLNFLTERYQSDVLSIQRNGVIVSVLSFIGNTDHISASFLWEIYRNGRIVLGDHVGLTILTERSS
jgi:hypothetical protein